MAKRWFQVDGVALALKVLALEKLTHVVNRPLPDHCLIPQPQESGSGRELPANPWDASLLSGRGGLTQDHTYSMREEAL